MRALDGRRAPAQRDGVAQQQRVLRRPVGEQVAGVAEGDDDAVRRAAAEEARQGGWRHAGCGCGLGLEGGDEARPAPDGAKGRVVEQGLRGREKEDGSGEGRGKHNDKP